MDEGGPFYDSIILPWNPTRPPEALFTLLNLYASFMNWLLEVAVLVFVHVPKMLLLLLLLLVHIVTLPLFISLLYVFSLPEGWYPTCVCFFFCPRVKDLKVVSVI